MVAARSNSVHQKDTVEGTIGISCNAFSNYRLKTTCTGYSDFFSSWNDLGFNLLHGIIMYRVAARLQT